MMTNLAFLSEQRFPVSRLQLDLSAALCASLPMVFALKSGDVWAAALGLTLAACGLLYAGWSMSPPRQAETGSPGSKWLLMSGLGTLLAVVSVLAAPAYKLWWLLWIVLPVILLALLSSAGSRSQAARHVLAPALFGSIIMFSATALGRPDLGAFPAAIAALFVAVLRATMDIEEDVFKNHRASEQVEVHHHYRTRLAVTAIIFFLFGTVSLWPWLGAFYGQTYFWILIAGVLIPLVFFWGRIRQPKLEGARTALIRFNRVAPLLGLIHLVAFLLA